MTRFDFRSRPTSPLLGRLVLVAVIAASARVEAQDSSAVLITPMRVTVTRDASRPALELPFGLTRLTVDEARASTRRANLTEMLMFVPGLSVSNRFNPTQDPRLAVRGFGARSAFGIRGVRVLRDGIPLTLPDGQTAVDFLDIETVNAAEVIRGSAGALYGNSSGGVIDFRTDPPPTGTMRARARGFYADGITRGSANLAGPIGPLGAQATYTHNEGEGPRDYSQFRNDNVLGDVRWASGGTQLQAQMSWYDSPLAENPGALTANEMAADPTKADTQAVRAGSSKTVRNSVIALQASHDTRRASISANLQMGSRDLENPQSFAIVVLDRSTYGASLRGQYAFGDEHPAVRVAAGADLLNQDDDRQNYTNCRNRVPRPAATCPGTADRGTITVDQRERVKGVGAYARAEYAPADQFSLTGMIRSDRTRFAVLNRRLATPAEEERTLSAVTPMVGVNWRMSALSSLYANVSSSFETPTTTELANQPDGSGGLNRELKPQHGVTYEVGAKGGLNANVAYDVSIFRVQTKDELIPFEIPGGGGRRFFRNAGETLRQGAEAGATATRGISSLGLAATWIKYTYEEFTVAGTSFAGHHVPGVAPQMVSANATLRPRRGLVALELQHVGRTPADDANQNYADAYQLLHLRAGWDGLERYGLRPSLGVDNLLDKTYAANVVVNAAGGRFYEPGPGRTFWLALTLSNRR